MAVILLSRVVGTYCGKSVDIEIKHLNTHAMDAARVAYFELTGKMLSRRRKDWHLSSIKKEHGGGYAFSLGEEGKLKISVIGKAGETAETVETPAPAPAETPAPAPAETATPAVGSRVEYNGPVAALSGKVGEVVSNTMRNGWIAVRFDGSAFAVNCAETSLRPAPAPTPAVDKRLSGLSHVQAECALAVWECMVERAGNGIEWLEPLFSDYGTVHMRHYAIAVAPYLDKVWNALDDDQQESLAPFDWEFIPRCLARMGQDWIDHSGPYFVPMETPAAFALTVMASTAPTDHSSLFGELPEFIEMPKAGVTVDTETTDLAKALVKAFPIATPAPEPAEPALERPFMGLDRFEAEIHKTHEVRFIRAYVRQANAQGRFDNRDFAVFIPITGSYHDMAAHAIRAINAAGFEVNYIVSHSHKKDCI